MERSYIENKSKQDRQLLKIMKSARIRIWELLNKMVTICIKTNLGRLHQDGEVQFKTIQIMNLNRIAKYLNL